VETRKAPWLCTGHDSTAAANAELLAHRAANFDQSIPPDWRKAPGPARLALTSATEISAYVAGSSSLG
jgi:hypothetical protein